MDGQVKSFAFLLLLLLLTTIPQYSVATVQEANTGDGRPQDNEAKDREPQKSSPSEPKLAAFPRQLDISTLKNMPVVVLQPRTPITFQMLPGENMESIHKSLSSDKILQLLQAATFNVPAKLHPPNKGEHRQARNRKFGNYHPQASVNRPVHFNSPALPRSFLNPQNNGWFQKFRGSFSNMFPVIKPFQELPTMNLPVFIPHQGSMQSINPFMLGSQQQFHILPWKNFHQPSMFPTGDLTTDASFIHPTRMFFGNSHTNHFRPAHIPHQQFGQQFGGDLATSGSALIPRRILPIGHQHFSRFTPPLQRHKPLFSNVGGLQAASMDISNAFADFTDSKEHGPGVTQRFGSVGHSITNFLKMMGLGAGGLSFDDVGGFGGGSDMAAMDSTPIARSMDFYPGYGNQAHLDDIEDFPEFYEDITEDFMNKMNLTNATSIEEKEVKKDMPKKEAILPPKMSLELDDKSKFLLNKGAKINKQIAKEVLDISYAPALPLGKINYGKLSTDKSKSESTGTEKYPEQPVVKYNVPPTHSTVAPHDRRKPIAIYQNFSPANQDSPKTTYAPAQEMPRPETEANPNKLVDEDEVRQWRPVNSGQGYVEKRPVPIVDVLQSSMHPESYKILQKVLSGGVHLNISKTT